MLDGIEVGDSCAVNVVIPLVPDSKAETPKSLNESRAKLRGGVACMEASLAVIVIMRAKPGGGNTTAEEVGPADDRLLCICPSHELKEVVVGVLAEIVGALSGEEVGSDTM